MKVSRRFDRSACAPSAEKQLATVVSGLLAVSLPCSCDPESPPMQDPTDERA